MIYILMIVAINAGKSHIDVDAIPFETKSRCVKNLKNVKEQVQKQGYDIVHTECLEKVLSRGN